MSKPQAILFDMDGVLVDSIDSWHQALKEVFRSHLDRELTKEEFVHKYWGRDIRDIFSDIGLDLDIGSFCNNVYDDHVDVLRIFPGTKDCLEALVAHRKAVITNTPEPCARQILQKGSIDGYFETVVTSDKVEKGKPDPAIVYVACRILDVEPKNTWLVGDHLFDMQAGRAAGCTVVGIGVQGDHTVQELNGLVDILSRS